MDDVSEQVRFYLTNAQYYETNGNPGGTLTLRASVPSKEAWRAVVTRFSSGHVMYTGPGLLQEALRMTEAQVGELRSQLEVQAQQHTQTTVELTVRHQEEIRNLHARLMAAEQSALQWYQYATGRNP